jgi:RNA polymerase sigma factor (sigma-70 family)
MHAKADGDLVASFVARKDEAAFEVLVNRHGPMVMGVCNRVLRNHADAEDAFQATFLVLVRRAASILPPHMIGNWLHGVAYRCALKLKTLAGKRQARQRQLASLSEPMTLARNPWDDLQPVLEQELSRLPDKYRIAIVLCDLEGKTRKQAARQLGWPEGSVSSRLSRARSMLAKRLTRLGIVLSAGSLAQVLAENSASAQVPAAMVISTVKAGILVATGQAVSAELVSLKVATLTAGVLKSMAMTKIKLTVLALVAGTLVLGSGGAWMRYALAARGPDTNAGPADAPVSVQMVHSFRGGPRHTGASAATGPLTQPVIRRRLTTEGPIRSSPLVVGTTVYVGSADRFLRALDAASGKELWRFETGGSVSSSPCFADGVVYVASRDRYVYAVGADNGQLRWRFAMGEDKPFPWGFEYFISSPLVVGDRVYVGGGDGCLYALDARSGVEVWKRQTGGRVRSSPAYADQTVFVGSADGCLYACDAAAGNLVWRFESEGTRIPPNKARFDRRSLVSSPAIGDSVVAIGGRDGFLYGVDRKTGKERWRFDHQRAWVTSSPAVAQGLALAGSGDGKFFQAVNLDDGKEKWHFPTEAAVFGSGTISGDAVYFSDYSGEVYCLAVQTGAKLWQVRLPGRVVSTPAIAEDGVVYVGCDDGCLYALEAPTVALKARGPARMAVYFDPESPFKFFTGDKQVRDYFADKGYEVLGPGALVGFLQSRAGDGAASVIVLATDMLPKGFGNDKGMELLQDYLKTGGKLVCLGFPPLYCELNGTKDPDLTDGRVKRWLGVPHVDDRSGEQHGVTITQDGFRWGLRKWWVGMQGVEPADVSTVLALDEAGRAAAWVKTFKQDAPGTGFVRLWGRPEPYPDLEELRAVVEYGIK